jgi:hypothetical protein
MSRLRALAWATVYSAQFETGQSSVNRPLATRPGISTSLGAIRFLPARTGETLTIRDGSISRSLPSRAWAGSFLKTQSRPNRSIVLPPTNPMRRSNGKSCVPPLVPATLWQTLSRQGAMVPLPVPAFRQYPFDDYYIVAQSNFQFSTGNTYRFESHLGARQ